MLETALFWIAAACYGVSTLAFLYSAGRESGYAHIAFYCLVAGVLFTTWSLAFRWITLGQGPFMTLYEVLASNILSLSLIFSLVYYFVPASRISSVVLLPVILIMCVWTLNVPSDPVPLPATFDNFWLWFHVLAGKLFLGFCLVSASLSTVLFLRSVDNRLAPVISDQSVHEIEHNLWNFFAVAFLAETVMLVVGSIWAHDAWGRYWAWDPLETWALVTWLTAGATLHIRLTYKIPQWTGWLLVILVFLLAFLTFFGVPFYSMAPHKGIF